MPPSSCPAVLYFGYGSNLWRYQMQQRCPTSEYLGISRLSGYRWIINERGYANIVELPKEETAHVDAHLDEVWGLVYSLQAQDEANLDVNEGVPRAYAKERLVADFWQARNSMPPSLDEKPKRLEMLVYINRQKIAPSQPKKEYISRMNRGIKDALKEGVPTEYVEKVMRAFIPDAEDEKLVETAKAQAHAFKDEH